MNALKRTLLKMGFIKRSAISLALGFVAALAVAIAFDEIYLFLSAHSGVAVVAGLIASQVWLYKPDKAQSAQGTTAPRQSAIQDTNPKQMSENQTPAAGAPVSSNRVTTLEEEVKSLGDDFSVADGELDDGEDPV